MSFEEAVSEEHQWTVDDIGRNTISGFVVEQSRLLLNIPSLLQSRIRHVRTADFDTYIKSISEVVDKYTANRAIGLDQQTRGTPELGDLGMRAATSAKDRRRNRMNVGKLTDVPSIFFDESFNLGNPFTFPQVMQHATLISGSDQVNAEANAGLQEKLSKYLDIVEVNLVQEIGKRSSSFFAALSNLQDLHADTSSCMKAIDAIRVDLDTTLNENAEKGSRLIHFHQQRNNLNKLYTSIKMVAEVRDAAPTIQLLLRQSDYLGALDLISAAHRSLEITSVHVQASIMNLSSNTPVKASSSSQKINAVKNFNLQLTEMTKLVSKMTETDLLTTITSWIDTLVAKTPLDFTYSLTRLPENTLEMMFGLKFVPGMHGVVPREMTVFKESLRAKLLHLGFSLVRTDRFLVVLQTVKESLIKDAKRMLKRHYPETPKDSSKARNQAYINYSTHYLFASMLSDTLKAMSIGTYSVLIRKTLCSALLYIEISQLIQDTLISILQDAQAKQVTIGTNIAAVDDVVESANAEDESDDDDDALASVLEAHDSNDKLKHSVLTAVDDSVSSFGHLITESSNLVYSVSETIHATLSKLILARIDQNSLLNVKDFFWIYSVFNAFIYHGEDVSKRSVYILKATLFSQSKAYLKHFHDAKSKQLTLMVDTESWNQAEVPFDFQMICQQITSHSLSNDVFSTSNENISTIESTSNEDLDYSPAGDTQTSEYDLSASFGRGTPSMGSGTEKKLMIEDQTYHAVVSVLIFLKSIVDYLHCVEAIPVLMTEIINRILDILKLFNAKTCQAILGAGAMRTAGLKNITARHITLAAQSVGIVTHLIPHIKIILRQNCSESQCVLLGEFDRLLKDFEEHQVELYAKLVSIMNERVQSHIANLRKTDWDASVSSEDNQPSTYMYLLVKETVLTKYLDQPACKSIMQEIFKLYTAKFDDMYKKLEIYSSAAKNRFIYFTLRFSSFDGINGPGSALEVAVNNIKIRDKRQQAMDQKFNQAQNAKKPAK